MTATPKVPAAPPLTRRTSNAEAGDSFGRAVAISGDTAVVGAYGEASNATGVNGNQNDNSADSAGASYLFTIDTTPNPCAFSATLTLTPNELTPADHRLVEVTATLKIPACISNASVKLVSITSSEPGQGAFQGDVPSDIQQAAIGTNDRRFLLRAERKPSSSPIITNTAGRKYTVIYDVFNGSVRKRLTGIVRVP